MPEITRRSLLSAGLLGGAAVALAACTSQGGPPPAATSGAAKIALWTHDKGYQQFFTTIAEGLNASKSTPFTYTLDTTIYAAPDLVTKFLAAASANQQLPDMLGIEIAQFPRLMSGGIAGSLLEPWDDRIAKVKDDIIASRLAPFTVDGHVYGLDSDNPLCVYYYRTDLFEKYKIPDPDTWEDFASFGANFHAQTGKYMLAIDTGPGAVASFLEFLLQRGGSLYDSKGNLALDSNETVETIDFLAAGLKSGFIVGVDNLYGGALQAGFKSDTVLGAAMPDWYNTYGIQATVPEQKGKWAIRPMPRFAGGGYPTSTWGGTGFADVKGHANTTAVADLVANGFLTVAGQVQRFKEIGYLPTLKSAYQSPELMNYTDPFLGGQKTFDVYSKLADKGPSYYQSPHLVTLTDQLVGPLQDAYKGKISAKAAVSQAISGYKQQVPS
ncbi:ABC transporter substrate-binding protein [Sinomonas terrae]|uniref:Extracellular solute-binding protein n=1 Tax=Sinomonas terrae TaxID=2908838 RepID=A0ABS9U5X7_9MICC|nr:extracellular solute-binding protein [Sinomonas terrae]MCH6472108.1 extracellular solute-binding protein [Sinomonas terrae]